MGQSEEIGLIKIKLCRLKTKQVQTRRYSQNEIEWPVQQAISERIV
jgi:hypothetical protein